MLFGDNMFVGDTAVDAVYLGNTQVWSAIPADVKAHIARVTADGGTVPEQAKMVSMVKKLIAANLWDSCVFFGLPLGGVKKDGNQFVSKVYDLRANADLLQATGTAQPKYDNGSLLYDGGDYIVSNAISINNPVNCNTQMTCIVTVRTIQNGITKNLISRANSNPSQYPTNMYIYSDGRIWVDLKGSNGVDRIQIESNHIIQSNINTVIGFTFDGTKSDKSERVNIYINGVVANKSQFQNGNLTSLSTPTTPICFGARLNDLQYKLPNNSQTALHQIYNSTLTAEQMLWNFNNIKAEV